MANPMECRFSPYTDNGGTCVGIAGKDSAILIADTRMSKGYGILTRKASKVTKLTDKCCIASCGMKADATKLHKVLNIRIQMYEHAHRKQPNLTAIAQMLSTILYHKRFFPYYTFNVLAGVDDDGKGGCYHYDAIGSFERVDYTTSGSGSALAHPVLDNVIQEGNHTAATKRKTEFLDQEKMLDLARDCLNSTAERDIFTGDAAEIWVINAAGVNIQNFELKKD